MNKSKLKTLRAKAPVTREQIARTAGASPAAVSSFFNDRYYAKDRRHGIGLSARTRQRIVEASRALNYQPPDPSWRVRLYPETGDFCFLLSQAAGGGFANEYFSRMVAGVMRQLAGPPPRHLVCAHFDENADYLTQEEMLPTCVRAGTVSRFLLAGAPNYSLLAVLGQSGYPVVYLSRYIALPGVCSVVPDFAVAARLAIERLVEAGHRQIAVVSPYYIHHGAGWNAMEFTRGLSEAAARMRLAFEPTRDIRVLPRAVSGQESSQMLADILASRPRPTAVFCLDDWAAMEIQRAAFGAGLELPRQLSVIGCNNHQNASSLHPSLTTVNIAGEEMGAVGFNELEAMLQQGLPKEPRRIVLPVQLIERESVSSPGAVKTAVRPYGTGVRK